MEAECEPIIFDKITVDRESVETEFGTIHTYRLPLAEQWQNDTVIINEPLFTDRRLGLAIELSAFAYAKKREGVKRGCGDSLAITILDNPDFVLCMFRLGDGISAKQMNEWQTVIATCRLDSAILDDIFEVLERSSRYPDLLIPVLDKYYLNSTWHAHAMEIIADFISRFIINTPQGVFPHYDTALEAIQTNIFNEDLYGRCCARDEFRRSCINPWSTKNREQMLFYRSWINTTITEQIVIIRKHPVSADGIDPRWRELWQDRDRGVCVSGHASLADTAYKFSLPFFRPDDNGLLIPTSVSYENIQQADVNWYIDWVLYSIISLVEELEEKGAISTHPAQTIKDRISMAIDKKAGHVYGALGPVDEFRELVGRFQHYAISAGLSHRQRIILSAGTDGVVANTRRVPHIDDTPSLGVRRVKYNDILHQLSGGNPEAAWYLRNLDSHINFAETRGRIPDDALAAALRITV